jgi:hypothetical protein
VPLADIVSATIRTHHGPAVSFAHVVVEASWDGDPRSRRSISLTSPIVYHSSGIDANVHTRTLKQRTSALETDLAKEVKLARVHHRYPEDVVEGAQHIRVQVLPAL